MCRVCFCIFVGVTFRGFRRMKEQKTTPPQTLDKLAGLRKRDCFVIPVMSDLEPAELDILRNLYARSEQASLHPADCLGLPARIFAAVTRQYSAFGLILVNDDGCSLSFLARFRRRMCWRHEVSTTPSPSSTSSI